MKIHSIHSAKLNPYQKAAEKQQALTSPSGKGDKLEISAQAKQLLQAPDTALTEREKKVNEIKKQYEAGNYQVNYTRAAEKMLKFWTD